MRSTASGSSQPEAEKAASANSTTAGPSGRAAEAEGWDGEGWSGAAGTADGAWVSCGAGVATSRPSPQAERRPKIRAEVSSRDRIRFMTGRSFYGSGSGDSLSAGWVCFLKARSTKIVSARARQAGRKHTGNSSCAVVSMQISSSTAITRV